MTATAQPRPPGSEPILPWPHPEIPQDIADAIDQEVTAAPKRYQPERRWRALVYAWIFQRTAAAVYMRRLEHLESLASHYRDALELADRVGAYAQIADGRLAHALKRTGPSMEPRLEINDAARWHRREDYAHRRIMMAVSDLVIAAERGTR